MRRSSAIQREVRRRLGTSDPSPLSPIQNRVLDFAHRFREETGNGPTARQAAAALRNSVGRIHIAVRALRMAGLVKFEGPEQPFEICVTEGYTSDRPKEGGGLSSKVPIESEQEQEQDFPTCPHCGYQHMKVDELFSDASGSQASITCEGCEERFRCIRDVIMTFRTFKIEGVKHGEDNDRKGG